MSRYQNGLRATIEMWMRVNDSVRNCGFHVANARLFVLDEMITGRIEAGLWGEDKYHRIMQHITMLIDEAKKATASAKIIYIFIIEDWLSRLLKMIDEGLKEDETLFGHFQLLRDWEVKPSGMTCDTLISERITPPDSMGDIPF